MTPLLLQFTGAQNTGKSTLVDTLLQKYNGEKIGEISRTMRAQNLISDVDINASLLDQIMLNSELIYQYYNKILNVADDSLIIAERSPYCCLGYFDNLSSAVTPAMVDYVHSYLDRFLQATFASKRVTVVTVFLPVSSEIPFKEDGVRVKASQDAVNRSIRSYLLKGNWPDAYAIGSVTLEGRVRQIEDLIEQYKPGLLSKLKKENKKND